MAQNDPFISRQIDLNLNLGQGYGEQILEQDLIQYATSVNISCGAHAGDSAYIDKSIKACKDYEDLQLGALISYPDLIGFGMRKIQLSNDELRATIISQLGAIAALAKSNGYEIQHVRAHGYLYQQLQSNYAVAETVANAMKEFSKWLILVGPSGKILEEVGSWTNVRVAYEARFDLRYKADASSIPFDIQRDGNLEIDTIAERARDLVYKSVVKDDSGQEADIKFETIHVPSRLKNAVEVAKLVRGMILKPLALRSVDYEPYLSEFI